MKAFNSQPIHASLSGSSFLWNLLGTAFHSFQKVNEMFDEEKQSNFKCSPKASYGSGRHPHKINLLFLEVQPFRKYSK